MCLALLDKAGLFILFICQSSLSRQDVTCQRFLFVCLSFMLLCQPHMILLLPFFIHSLKMLFYLFIFIVNALLFFLRFVISVFGCSDADDRPLIICLQMYMFFYIYLYLFYSTDRDSN